jgi:hypothetical protein
MHVKHYFLESLYNVHLMNVQGMYNVNCIPKNTLYPDILPNLNEPDRYCCACEKRFKRKVYYYTHLRIIHRISSKLQQQRTDSNLPSNLGNCCSVCRKQFYYVRSYQDHLKMKHNVYPPVKVGLYCSFCSMDYTY